MAGILLIPTNIHDAKANPCSDIGADGTGGYGGGGGSTGPAGNGGGGGNAGMGEFGGAGGGTGNAGAGGNAEFWYRNGNSHLYARSRSHKRTINIPKIILKTHF